MHHKIDAANSREESHCEPCELLKVGPKCQSLGKIATNSWIKCVKRTSFFRRIKYLQNVCRWWWQQPNDPNRAKNSLLMFPIPIIGFGNTWSKIKLLNFFPFSIQSDWIAFSHTHLLMHHVLRTCINESNAIPWDSASKEAHNKTKTYANMCKMWTPSADLLELAAPISLVYLRVYSTFFFRHHFILLRQGGGNPLHIHFYSFL